MLYEISPEVLASLAGRTTLNDFKTAEQIFRFAKSNGYSVTDAAAFCLRHGIRIGRRTSAPTAYEAYRLLHEYQGRNDKSRLPAQRIMKAAEWIHSPAELRALAEFLAARAENVEAGIAVFPDDDMPQLPDQLPDQLRAQAGQDQTGSTDIDVNSDGIKEVE